MTTPDREKRTIVLRRTERGLEPRSRMDRELLEQYAIGSDVEVTVRKRRSHVQLRRYWVMLHEVVEATGAFPDAERLHEALKLDLGFVTPMKLLDGRMVYVPDSAAMSKMDAAEFRRFFDAAAKRLAEVCGFDPLTEMADREAA